MSEIEISEGNIMIAEFIGVDLNFSDKVYKQSKSTLKDIIDNRYKTNGLLFNESWDWLMPVVAKIESLKVTFSIIGMFSQVIVWEGSEIVFAKTYGGLEVPKIEAVYLCVVAFIDWVNSKHL